MTRDESPPLPVPPGWEDDYKLAFESRYLGRQHLRGKDLTLTISAVQLPVLVMVSPGKKPQKKRKLVIEFHALRGRTDGTPFEWIVCKTNADVIAMLHGRAPLRDWIGKRITIFDDPTVEAFGKVVGGIRVRPTRPPAQERQRPAQGQTPGSPPPVAAAAPGPASPPSDEEIEEIMRRESEEHTR